jgi:hypothetical protein
MDNLTEEANVMSSMSGRLPPTDYGIADLIEAVETLRRKKLDAEVNYTETFFSAAKQYLG